MSPLAEREDYIHPARISAALHKLHKSASALVPAGLRRGIARLQPRGKLR